MRKRHTHASSKLNSALVAALAADTQSGPPSSAAEDLPYSEKLVEPLHDAEFDGGEEKVGTQNVHDNGYRFPE